MKYIIPFIIVVALILLKPWEISFAGSPTPDLTDTISDSIIAENNLHLLPVNHLITNKESDLSATRRMDRIIERFMEKWEIKGASFALMKDDRLIYSKGYGYADLEADISMDVKHILRIASVSKLITAVGIMKLVEENKLKLNDYVFGSHGILNDSIYSKIKDPRCKRITVEQLLRHQGGFSIAYGDPMFCPLDIARKMNVTPPIDLSTTIQFVLSRRLGYTPGEATIYSNVGYGILTKVIEKVSGEDYETYIQDHILHPAGCSDMYLGKNEERLPNEVQYYEVSNAELISACDGSGRLVYKSNGGNNIEELYGAGGWVASPSELLRFLAAVDGKSGVKDILKPQSIRYMTQAAPHILPIGWMETTFQGDWIRTGTLAGTSALMKNQKDGYAWIFVTNTSSWKGSRFPRYIDATITHALATVTEWPDRDLFDCQKFDYEKLLVIR